MGRGLTSMLMQQGHIVIGVSHHDLDIINFEAVDRRVAEAAPEVIIHCAAMTNVDRCAQYPDEALRINGIGTQNVALACQRYQSALCYLSTNEVFDGERTTPYLEYDTPQPANPYGYSKWVGEQIVQRLVPQHYIVRLSWLFAHGGSNFLQKIVTAAEAGRPLSVVTNETACPTYADDLMIALTQLLPTRRYGIYHLINDGSASRYEFARHILDCYGFSAYPINPILKTDFARLSVPPTHSVLRNFMAEQIGIRLRHWRDAVAAFVERERTRVP